MGFLVVRALLFPVSTRAPAVWWELPGRGKAWSTAASFPDAGRPARARWEKTPALEGLGAMGI